MSYFRQAMREERERLKVKGCFPGDIVMKTSNDANLPKQQPSPASKLKASHQSHSKALKNEG